MATRTSQKCITQVALLRGHVKELLTVTADRAEKEVCMYVWMDGWMDGGREGWMDGCRRRWAQGK